MKEKIQTEFKQQQNNTKTSDLRDDFSFIEIHESTMSVAFRVHDSNQQTTDKWRFFRFFQLSLSVDFASQI
jgi:hypothetical protein